MGWAVGGVTTRILWESKSKIAFDLCFGVVGCLTGAFASGWASQRTYNSEVPRKHFIWDEMGRAVDLRTALAEHQGLLAILGTVTLVVLWRLAVAAYRRSKAEIIV